MASMPALPKIGASPVIEVVLGVQFPQLAKLSSAHIGWYWRDCLSRDWNSVNDTKPLDPINERFGEPEWVTPGIKISEAPSKLRVQFISQDGRMVQVQDSRFYYNWRRKDGDYPTFDRLFPEFEHRFEEFREFMSRSGVSDKIVTDYWDVTYVNHIPIGSLWDRGKDWRRISPALFPPSVVETQAFETGQCEWSFLLEGSKGRLRVKAQHAKTQGETEQEVINLQLLARGPVLGDDYRSGLNLGHEHLVRFFAGILSPEANAAWKRNG